jgi:hypothetical protein
MKKKLFFDAQSEEMALKYGTFAAPPVLTNEGLQYLQVPNDSPTLLSPIPPTQVVSNPYIQFSDIDGLVSVTGTEADLFPVFDPSLQTAYLPPVSSLPGSGFTPPVDTNFETGAILIDQFTPDKVSAPVTPATVTPTNTTTTGNIFTGGGGGGYSTQPQEKPKTAVEQKTEVSPLTYIFIAVLGFVLIVFSFRK